MNPVPGAVNAPHAPQVNLLPPEIGLRRSASRARAVIFTGVVVFVLLLVGVWFLAFSSRQAAESDLADENAKTPQLQAELATYDYIPVLEAQLNNSVTARAWAGSVDITWYNHLSALFKAIPSDTRVTSLSVSQATPSAPVATDGTVFGVPDLGVLTFSGTATAPINAAALEDAIDALPGFENTWIDVTAITPIGESKNAYWSYSGSTRLTASALSGRTVTEQTQVPASADGSEG